MIRTGFLKASVLALMTIPAAASDLLHKDAEKAFTVFPEFSVNLESVMTVTYGFLVKVKKFQEEDTIGFHVTTKTVTMNDDGSTKKLPFPNYPHKNKYLIFCLGDASVTEYHEDGEFVNEVINLVNKEDIKAGMGPGASNPESFYYDLWWAVCKNELRVFTSSFYEEFKKSVKTESKEVPFTELKIFDSEKADGSFYITNGFFKKKKTWSGEGMSGFEVTIFTEDSKTKEKSKDLNFIVTCEGDVPSVSDGRTPSEENGTGEMIVPEFINTGVGTSQNIYYDLWWSVCKNVNKKFTQIP